MDNSRRELLAEFVAALIIIAAAIFLATVFSDCNRGHASAQEQVDAALHQVTTPVVGFDAQRGGEVRHTGIDAAMPLATGSVFDPIGFDEPDTIVVAKALVAEAAPAARTDHLAIIAVLRYRLRLNAHRGWSLAEMAKAYCAIFRARNPTRRQLDLLQREVTAIPRPVLALARAAVRGTALQDPCKGRAVHWGNGTTDLTPLPRIDCGRTENAFYSDAVHR